MSDELNDRMPKWKKTLRDLTRDETVPYAQRRLTSTLKLKSQRKVNTKSRQYGDVTFLLRIPSDLWEKFIRTVPISRTRHDFILDLIQQRVWEYEKAAKNL